MGQPQPEPSCKSAPARWPGVLRSWPVWLLPARLRGYVIAVIAAGVVATGTAAAFTPWRARDAIMYGILLAIGAVTVESIRKVRNGQFIINEKIFAKPAVATKVLAEFRELSVYGPGSSHVFAPLSPREVQILDNIAQGMTNKEVAYTLAISEQTVKNHMSSILRKLSVNDRTQAVVYAMRQGWIKGPEMGT